MEYSAKAVTFEYNGSRVFGRASENIAETVLKPILGRKFHKIHLSRKLFHITWHKKTCNFLHLKDKVLTLCRKVIIENVMIVVDPLRNV